MSDVDWGFWIGLISLLISLVALGFSYISSKRTEELIRKETKIILEDIAGLINTVQCGFVTIAIIIFWVS